MNGTVELVDSVPEAFARLIADRLGGIRHDPVSLALSGGTAKLSYEALAALTGPDGERPLEWSSVDVYLSDERCVPPDDADSNHRMIEETLLRTVGPTFGDHPMYVSGAAEDAAAAYRRIVADLEGLDVVHLGLGPDGHTASLFAGSDALAVDDPELLVVASRDPNARNPHDRITLTLPALARARLVVFTVAGRAKADAFGRLAAGEDLPASRVTADEVVWLVDHEAAEGTVYAG